MDRTIEYKQKPMEKDQNESLDSLRQNIDQIDLELLNLFEKRMNTVLKIAKYKLDHNLEILDQFREEKVLAKTASLKNDEMEEYAVDFLISLMNVSKRLQADYLAHETCDKSNTVSKSNKNEKECRFGSTKITVGYQGVPGSYSEEALRNYFREDITSQNYTNFGDVFKALQIGEIDYGVLPLENSFTGGIAEVYDLLCQYGYYIVGEKCVHVRHNLLASPGVKIEDIQEVYSHPQALLQCSKYLKDRPNWNSVPCSNTAVSAKLISEQKDSTKAAIASERAAKLYGLSILKKGINNNPQNYTRFIIIGRHLNSTEKNNKISLSLAIPHEPGSLHRILSYFAENKLNMLKIESRPIQDKTWEYLFYIDFEGNLRNPKVRSAVDSIQKNSTFFRLLGNYPSDKEILYS